MKTARMLGPLAVVLAVFAGACSDDDDKGGGGGGSTGSVQVFVVPEDTISDGLEPGEENENIRDGWAIQYSRYLVAFGNFRASSTQNGGSISDPNSYILDLKKAGEQGYVLKTFTDVAAVRWDKVGFDIPNAKAGAKPLGETSQADTDFMIQNGYSVYFEGTAKKDADTISFKWGFSAGTSFEDCAADNEVPGFAVPQGGTVQVKPTLHGDHQYFDNVTHGAEITKRYAQWMKDCDKDTNSELTLAELKQCNAATALPTSKGYQLAGVTDKDGDGAITVYDYVNTQLRTFGDYQGDGECPTRTALP